MSKDPSRTEEATPKRRSKVRQEGNVPKSGELSKATSLIGGVIALRFCVKYIGEEMANNYQWLFRDGMRLELTQTSVMNLMIWSSLSIAKMIMPTLLILCLVGYLTMRLQVGSLWTTEALGPKFDKVLNPFPGLKNVIFNPKMFIQLARSALQAVAVAVPPYLLIRDEMNNILPLFYQEIPALASYMLELGYRMTWYAIIPMLIIGLADLWYVRWDYEENIKMSKDEIKDERKQSEGDPTIKAKQRQKMMAVMRKRMLKAVPTADVVVTNPTHYAVALRYDPKEAPAPVVVAKGVDFMAQKIKDIARENRVPIRENKPLAQALYKNIEVGNAISEDLYKAVASILAEIFRIKGRRS